MTNISEQEIHSYQVDGVVCLSNIFETRWIERESQRETDQAPEFNQPFFSDGFSDWRVAKYILLFSWLDHRHLTSGLLYPEIWAQRHFGEYLFWH
jgi:hypothetical protein